MDAFVDLVHVAVGVVFDANGQFLMTTRPPGKVYAGYWEFPGGKIETGETVEQALARELQEELGIVVQSAQPWRTLDASYPHAQVRLHFSQVHNWSGRLEMREGQRFSWQTLPVSVAPVLPGSIPVLDWLAQRP
jgi:8-oxo-dGTP diphosphatase